MERATEEEEASSHRRRRVPSRVFLISQRQHLELPKRLQRPSIHLPNGSFHPVAHQFSNFCNVPSWRVSSDSTSSRISRTCYKRSSSTREKKRRGGDSFLHGRRRGGGSIGIIPSRTEQTSSPDGSIQVRAREGGRRKRPREDLPAKLPLPIFPLSRATKEERPREKIQGKQSALFPW